MRKITKLIILVLVLTCIATCSMAERMSWTYQKTIPVYDVNTGRTTNETFTAVVAFMSYNLSSTTMTIDGARYKVYTSASYVTNDLNFGPLSTFGSVNQEGLTTYYNPSEYSLKVTAVPFQIDYTYYTRGTRDANGNISFGGNASDTKTPSGSRIHTKQLIQ